MSFEAGRAVPAKRLHYLDWLRIGAILAVFLHHVSKFFDFDTNPLSNTARSLAASVHREFDELWMMPLFFVISAAAVFYSLNSRGTGSFLKERFLRIFIPLAILGSFVINPPRSTFSNWATATSRAPSWPGCPTSSTGSSGPTAAATSPPWASEPTCGT